jgi:hypothetical protein
LILFGGVRGGGQTFCNQRCYQSWQAVAVSQQVSPDVIQKRVWEVHQGLCPKCHGSGPVDVHTAYQVWSALLLTSWKNEPQVSCRACGRKRQVTSLVFTLVAGWWGFPWGLIMTPVQVVRNLRGILGGPDPQQPSAQLEKAVRLSIAQQALPARAS